MLSLQIIEQDVKNFMNILLKENIFDFFEVRGVDIYSFTKFNIAGNSISSESSEMENKKYCTWQEIRPFVFNIIKGCARPKNIKIVFSLNDFQMNELHKDAASVFLNLYYEGSSILFTTASSYKNFTMDKSLDTIWEHYICDFFKKNRIAVLQLGGIK